MRYQSMPRATFSTQSAVGLALSLCLSVTLSACVTTNKATNVQTAAVATTATKAESAKAPDVYTFKKGQLLSFISIVSKDTPEAKAAAQTYLQTAFPLASKHGLKREGQLLVKGVPVGDHQSEGIIIYSWPDQMSEANFEAEAEWPSIKSLRPVAWEDLRIYTKELEEDLTLTFEPNKMYTLAMAWSNPENPDHYDLYMDGIKDAVSEVGGRFVYKMFDPKFESNTIKDGGPSQVTLVEWDSLAGLQNFGKTDGFKQNAHYLNSGVTRFEILALGTQ